ncbi:HAD family hydrolase [Nocardia vermiculata]|uniref:HAD family hydrolase n=1 Tax=Nocardia vermiculata TaxID=257274 RepID=UPI0008347F69|nr:HAD family hydrolase [Nocardia vermiculata]
MTGPADLLTSHRCLLLDFDGPICSVFSGITSREAVDYLGKQLDTPLPSAISETTDPFDVLGFAEKLGPSTAARIERAFARVEREAMAVSHPTPGAAELIRRASHRGYTVAVVSNNSASAIAAYLDDRDLHRDISGIFARTSADLTALKPSAYLLNLAMRTLSTTAEHTVFVGDSTTDIQAARAARVSSIAFANRPEKIDRLAAHGPDAVITRLADLTDALSTE